MNILAIETSCDETSIALVACSGGIKNPRFKVLQNIVSSQIAVHAPFGGVVPNLAKREHIRNLPLVLKRLLRAANSSNLKLKTENLFGPAGQLKTKNLSLDAIAVTVGPGLEPALWTGIEFAKELHTNLQLTTNNKQLKLLGANHMEGHLYSNWLNRSEGSIARPDFSKSGLGHPKIQFPAVALVVSGGHTILLVMQSFMKWKKLGETRDDAVGEAFDKVARMLGLPYPGGPAIEKLAKRGDCDVIDFPQPMRDAANYDFSFSGLKTSVLYYLRDRGNVTSDKDKADIAASFEKAATDVLVHKARRAAQAYGAKSILLCGGVAANRSLRKKLSVLSSKLGVSFYVPPFEYNTDNAAMIAAAAYVGTLRKKKYRITAQGNLTL